MKYHLFLFLTLCLTSCSILQTSYTVDNLNQDDHYPRWLKKADFRTDQTSGVTFLREDNYGQDEFLMVDDVGQINRLKILDDTVFNFTPLFFSNELTDFLKTFPKVDFEEIAFDKFTNEVYISVEGNGPDFLKFNGIYKLNFKDNNIYSDTIISLMKIDILPAEKFNKYIRENIGYEGLAVNENYLVLGLEGMVNPDKSFNNNTLLLLVNKSDFTIIKEINTEEFNIVSICGLYSESDSKLWGIDRNSKILFRIEFDDSLNIKSFNKTEVKTVIPSYNHIEYTGSLESITMNNKNNIFLIDDPWHSHFVPDSVTMKKLDKNTLDNFKEFVPIIYKFNLE